MTMIIITFVSPRFFSAIIVFLLILGVFPSQINVKIILLIVSTSGVEIVRSEALYSILARTSVLMMFIVPMRVRFFLFQLCRICFRSYTFSSNFNLLATFDITGLIRVDDFWKNFF